jgi:hypothetical protein
MSFSWYERTSYFDFPELEAWCEALAAAYPDWVALESIGETRHGRPILLLTLGKRDGKENERPAFWIDGGTHAVEWTGVMNTVACISSWVRAAVETEEGKERLRQHTVYAVPCISPDGFQAMHEGAPFLRSSLRPPVEGTERSGFDPCDIDGDGVVRWMRWKHPAGPFVADPELPVLLRPRSLEDDPADAYFLCPEGEFINWDGKRWHAAAYLYGQDLNRNFPAHWKPFAMFGMDGGRYPLSENETRAVVDAFDARRNIGAALTNHTYTGCLLTAPHSPTDPLPKGDVLLLRKLADAAVEGTGYRVFSTHPEFTYDEKNPVVGTWDECLGATFGVAGYTFELWDPFGTAGVDNPDPAKFFMKPDASKLKAMVKYFADNFPDSVRDWQEFEHPQLGAVEIGGLDYLHTVRNPPLEMLPEELEKGLQVADRLFRALPRVTPTLHVEPLSDDIRRVELIIENVGYLPTSSLQYGETIGTAGACTARIRLDDGIELVDGLAGQTLNHLDGWGNAQAGSSSTAIYSQLPGRGHRAVAKWLVRGPGEIHVSWNFGRGGQGTLAV